jgi:hypothetical protein
LEDNEVAVTSLPRLATSGAVVIVTAALCVFAAAGRLIAHKTVVSPYTYYADVKPIVERRCATCHDGRARPSFTFDLAAVWPYNFQRSLLSHSTGMDAVTVAEFDTLMTWSAGGSPEGPRPPGAPASALPKQHSSHGGEQGGAILILFDDTMHAELVWQEQRRVRVFVTDAYGKALTLPELRQLRARVTGPSKKTSALEPSKDGEYLEARVDSAPMPATFEVVIRRPDATESTAAMTLMAHSLPPPSFEVPPTVIPKTVAEMVAALREHSATARAMVNAGQFGSLYLPTTHVRDLVLAIAQRSAEQSAVLKPMMRATWALHLAGDLGTPTEIRQAADVFDAAMAAVNEPRKH